jgi:hypothetical protein
MRQKRASRTLQKRSSNASVTLQKRSSSILHVLLDASIHCGRFYGQWARRCGALLAPVRPLTPDLPLQGKLRAKVPAKSSYSNFEGYFLEFVRMEIWYKLKYTHSWFGTRKNMRQRMYHFIILTHVTNLLDGYF